MSTVQTLPEKIEKLKHRILAFEDWEDRYSEIIKIGRELPGISDELKSEKFRIRGCQSQVWLVPEFKQGRLWFQADSDAVLVKGIVALLVQVYSGGRPDEILEEHEDFLTSIGIAQHLSMNRSNGLAAMVKQIKLYAVAFKAMEVKS